MSKKRDIKLRAKQKYTEDLEQKKAGKAELADLPKDQQTAAKQADQEAKKTAKKQHKEALKGMEKAQKKEIRLFDKYYKKYRTRTRRYSIWSVVGVLILILIIQIAPLVSDIKTLMNIQLNTGTPEAEAAIVYGESIAQAISDEGIVLLKNEGQMLPLKEKKVNVFGKSAMNLRTGGGGSGGADQTRAVDFFEGLNNAGIEYNKDLYGIYAEMNQGKEQATGMGQVLGAFIGGKEEVEPEIGYLTTDLLGNAKEYSENAIVVLSNISVEASDSTVEDLRLSQNQADLIDTVAANFENVTIIINAGNARELGFVEEYPSIKSVLWVGIPGPKGANSIGRVLSGEVNPSGRLVDTYVYNLEEHPSIVNFGDYQYENIDKMAFLNYEEGIYVGYRFFETYYQNNEEGYKKAVQYPFGYGLSYTDFEWEVINQTMDNNQIRLEIQVTNQGDVPGKDVVQAYFKAPYTEGGIEKSAIELAGYAKTSLLQPGKSETVTIEFATRDMSSYDMNEKEAFILEKGTYQILVSKNVHTPVETFDFQVAEEIVYVEDDATGTAIENQFSYADGGLTYLSRNDWEGTYPDSKDNVYQAPKEVVDAFAAKPEKMEGTVPTTGADNGIMLQDLKGLDYEDPMWEQYLDQFTTEEMGELVNKGAYRTVEIERLGLPASTLLDGPAGINFFFAATSAASFPTEVIIASTWNNELAYQWGEAVGKEANVLGVHGWYAPAMNVHRSPLGGRNFEYFSEDPMLSGMISASAIKGAQSQNVLVFIKHFVLNEQEINARSGVSVWANEQAMREVYFRPFEIAVKEGDATGVMSSFIHIGPKWAGGNPELLQNLLREEWGFEGLVSTDAVLGKFMDLNLAIRYGNELMLNPMPNGNMKYFKKLHKEDPVGIVAGLRERTHTICYTLLNETNLIK